MQTNHGGAGPTPVDSGERLLDRYLQAVERLIGSIERQPLAMALDRLQTARANGQSVFVFGNGGSAAIASQMVVDLVKGASIGRKQRFRAMCLSDNVPTLTAISNDLDYESVFVEPLRNFAINGDVVFAISGSGASPNVLRAVEYANSIGCDTIGLTSSDHGQLRKIVDIPLTVHSSHAGQLEDCAFVMTHALCYGCQETEPTDSPRIAEEAPGELLR